MTKASPGFILLQMSCRSAQIAALRCPLHGFLKQLFSWFNYTQAGALDVEKQILCDPAQNAMRGTNVTGRIKF
jgi:hypothetical protein